MPPVPWTFLGLQCRWKSCRIRLLNPSDGSNAFLLYSEFNLANSLNWCSWSRAGGSDAQYLNALLIEHKVKQRRESLSIREQNLAMRIIEGHVLKPLWPINYPVYRRRVFISTTFHWCEAAFSSLQLFFLTEFFPVCEHHVCTLTVIGPLLTFCKRTLLRVRTQVGSPGRNWQ